MGGFGGVRCGRVDFIGHRHRADGHNVNGRSGTGLSFVAWNYTGINIAHIDEPKGPPNPKDIQHSHR